MSIKKRCDRCGQCCLQGGPALHTQDVDILRQGHIRSENLITVRKGELAFQPLAEEATPVEKEFLKMQGTQSEWNCMFYDMAQKMCSIYRNRPLACRVLECTAPDPLLAITGKNLLTRFDLIADDDPLLPFIKEHEAAFPCPSLLEVKESLQDADASSETLHGLQERVNGDIQYRTVLLEKFGLTVGQELFAFGRPLFQLLSPLGITVEQTPSGMVLHYMPE